jgi:hypothetical protein
MHNHIGHYLATKVAQPLAAEFGDRLERMSKTEKLLLINILSGGLHELAVYPNISEYSFIEFCLDSEMPAARRTSVMPLLRQFDGYDSSTIETILMVLVLSMQNGG